MNFAARITIDLICGGLLLLWARSSRLDFGLRKPLLAGIWPWLLAYVGLSMLMWILAPILHEGSEAGWNDPSEQLSMFEVLLISVVTGPIVEELAFRGAFFAVALRWGVWAAVLIPSVVWGALHIEGDEWRMVPFSLIGGILAMVRWKSGSVYVPLVLHAANNLFVTLSWY